MDLNRKKFRHPMAKTAYCKIKYCSVFKGFLRNAREKP